MTDDLSRELDDVAASVPAIPNDYAYLQSLIQSLPSPLSPELRSAAVGVLATSSPDAGAAGMAASMIGSAPGVESGAGTGVVSEIFYGNSNLLANPVMENPGPAVTMSTTDQMWAYAWYGRHVINSGSTPTQDQIGFYTSRTNRNENPFNSAVAYIALKGSTAGAVDETIYVTSGYWQADDDSAMTWLSASIKLTLMGDDINDTVTLFRARMEIVNNRPPQTITLHAAGPWFDIMPLENNHGVFRINTAMARPIAGWDTGNLAYHLRLRIDYVTNAARTTGTDYLLLGEPSLAFSSTQAPPPFAPIIASWIPNQVSAYDNTMFLSAILSGVGLQLGAGGAIDVRLYRSAARTLKITGGTVELTKDGTTTAIVFPAQTNDPGYIKHIEDNNAAEMQFSVSDDDADTDLFTFGGTPSSTWREKFAITASGKLLFSGTAKERDTNLYRDSANVLKTDDSLVVAGTLIAQPSTAQTLAAGTAIVANANIVQINSSGNVTITAAPTIANGVDGQCVTIVNVDTADTITLQDQGTLASSNLRLTATTVALAPRQSLQLMYSSAIGDWVQIANKVAVL